MAQLERKLPSDRTIAFAAAVVSSKPADLTVREYISLLNRHVAKGRRENALSAAYRHLDRSAYWRSECERAKADYRAAEEARIDALREVDTLKARLEAAKSAGAGTKRKRGNADIVPYSREIKKGRKDAEEKREVFLGGLVIEEVEIGDEDVGVQSLMRKLYQIGMFFKPGLQVSTKDLAYHLCATAAETAKVVADALDQQSAATSDCNTTLATTMTAAGRMVAGMLAGLQKLVRMETSQASLGQVTYALVRMYESLLAGFDCVSKREVLKELTCTSTDRKSSSEKQKAKSKAGPPRVNIRDVPVLNALTSLLSGILKQLEPKQEPHTEIFEGFLFCVLSKLGERVYAVNFSKPRAASIVEELDSAASSEDSDTEPTSNAVPLPVRQAQLEAPYLIHLLKQSLALSPSFLNPPASTASKSTKSKSNPKLGSVTKATLALAVKERLQSTLVNAIFGPEGVDEESDLFINCLQMPAAGGSPMTMPRVKETEVGVWFQGEVWRMLGWEVLGREMDNRLRVR